MATGEVVEVELINIEIKHYSFIVQIFTAMQARMLQLKKQNKSESERGTHK